MTKWKWVLRLVLVLVGAVELGSAIIFLPDSPEKEMRRLSRMIDSGLRRGSSRIEVEDWLRGHDFQDFYPSGDIDSHFTCLNVCLDREYFWAGRSTIHLYFFFDKAGRFSDCHLEWDENSF